MKHNFLTIAALAMSVAGGVFVPTLKADEWDKKTTITIDQAIEVQGFVLEPGSYVMKLLSSNADRHIVQIFSADETHFVGNVFAAAAYRQTITGDSEFKFYEAMEGQPPALRTWFYPGDNDGFDFRALKSSALAKSTPANTHNSNASAGGGN
jgi:hypothetical protein